MNSVIIVIPCYNEAERFPINKFTEFIGKGPRQRFILVNDGSTDGTLQVLATLRDSAPDCFQLLNLPKNSGKAEATRAGMLLAFDNKPDYVGYWDADLATPLEAICGFCELLDSNPRIEMVFGARVRLLGRYVERSTFRHYPGRIFASAASMLLGIGVYDTQCGAKLFRATPTIRSLFEEPFLTRWLFDVEIIARLIRARQGTALPQAENVIYELPLQEWRDVAGSKVKPLDFFKAFAGLGKIYWRYLRP